MSLPQGAIWREFEADARTRTLAVTKTGRVHGEIVERLKSAKIRLRSDRVVNALSATLKSAIAHDIRAAQSIVVTITAPIRRPSQTAAVLADTLSDGIPDLEVRKVICGNQVRVRSIPKVATKMPKLVVLVHNPGSDSDHILNVAESCLRKTNNPG